MGFCLFVSSDLSQRMCLRTSRQGSTSLVLDSPFSSRVIRFAKCGDWNNHGTGSYRKQIVLTSFSWNWLLHENPK